MFLIEVMGSVLVIDLLEIESDCKNIKLYVKINYQQQKNIYSGSVVKTKI